MNRDEKLKMLGELPVFEPRLMWEPISGRIWEENLEQVKSFMEKDDRLPVLYSKDPAEKRLGVWRATQKVAFKRGKMTPERIKALESIPGWEWESDFDDRWQENLEKVRVFQKKHGRLPSEESKDPEEKRLGRWNGSQRRARKGNGGRMTPERVAVLESIPGWGWSLDDRWQKNLEEVRAFQKKHGRLLGRSRSAEDASLVGWCRAQRQAYSGTSKGKMTPERIKALESIPGWEWESDFDDRWQENLEKVRAFQKKHGRLPYPKSKDLEENRLGRWNGHQRHARNGDGHYKMTPERIKALESIPGWKWESDFDNRWQKNLEEVRAFQKKHGRLPYPKSKDLEENRLGRWIAGQKCAYSGNGHYKMTPKRIKALEAIEGWRWPK